MKRILIILLIAIHAISLSAQSPDKDNIDSLFKRIEQYEKGMGSISIFRNGKEIYHYSFGWADVKNHIRAEENTKYRIGSVSKSFTATIIMQMIEEDHLRLNTKLSEFFPEIPNAEKVTIEQLLRHKSGLYNFTNSKDYLHWMEQSHTKKELLQIFTENGTIFEPGKKSVYSNTNYVLLSWIAEKIDEKPFCEILKSRIIIPCHLKNTYYGGKINPAEHEALSYNKYTTWVEATETDMSIPAGAGGIVSNPTDLNIFYNHLFYGKLVSTASLQKMTETGEGFGIGIFRLFDSKAYGHTGGIDGFQATVAFFPEDSIFLTYLTNGVVLPKADIIRSVLKILNNETFELPEFKTGVKLTSKDINPYLGVYGSTTNPLKITVFLCNNTLTAQVTGQEAIPFEAMGKHRFIFEPARIELEFIPSENKMILKQGTQKFELLKEE